jgi:hypothetical protein
MEENNVVISAEQIIEKCADKDNSLTYDIKKLYAGLDFADPLNKDPTACILVIISVDTNNIITIENVRTISKQEDLLFSIRCELNKFNIRLGVGGLGYSNNDISHKLQQEFDDRYLSSRLCTKILNHLKYNNDEWPRVIGFEKDYYIEKMLNMLENGFIRIPYNVPGRVDWLIKQFEVSKTESSMGIFAGIQTGLLALINAYLAWEFDMTKEIL